MMSLISKNAVSLRCGVVFFLLALFPLTGCRQEEAPPPKPTVVKKRIAQSPAGAETTEQTPGKEAEKKAKPVQPGPPAAEAPVNNATLAESPAAVSVQAPAVPQKDITPPPPPAGAASPPSDSLKSSLPGTLPHYNPVGRVDPFSPLFKDEPTGGAAKKKKPQRPLTPLEKIDLSQLKLVAVLRAESGNRAMVEDASGKGYVLTNGTYVGINSGRVVKILSDRVVVEEQLEDYMGRTLKTERELKLQKPFGEE